MTGYIYIITNLLNDKIYIGQHVCPVFDFNYWGSGKHLKRAINKYGIENFSRGILEWCETIDELNEKEKFYIKEYRAQDPKFGYNICFGGQIRIPKGYWHHSKASKLKLHNANKGQIPWSKGKHLPEEWRRKIGEANKISLKGKPQPWKYKKVILDDNLIFESCKSCAKYLNIGTPDLRRALLKGKYKSHKLSYFKEEK